MAEEHKQVLGKLDTLDLLLKGYENLEVMKWVKSNLTEIVNIVRNGSHCEASDTQYRF